MMSVKSSDQKISKIEKKLADIHKSEKFISHKVANASKLYPCLKDWTNWKPLALVQSAVLSHLF